MSILQQADATGLPLPTLPTGLQGSQPQNLPLPMVMGASGQASASFFGGGAAAAPVPVGTPAQQMNSRYYNRPSHDSCCGCGCVKSACDEVTDCVTDFFKSLSRCGKSIAADCCKGSADCCRGGACNCLSGLLVEVCRSMRCC